MIRERASVLRYTYTVCLVIYTLVDTCSSTHLLQIFDSFIKSGEDNKL